MVDTKANLKKYVTDVIEVLNNLPIDDLDGAVKILRAAYENGNVVYTMGNGGHGSTASHFANDLTKHTMVSDDKDKVLVTGRKFRSLCMCDNPYKITEWANDMGFENAFVEPLSGWFEKGDVVVGISGSGNSENVLKAFRLAKERGGKSICFSGRDGGKAVKEADICIIVPTDKMVQIEDVHVMMAHACADVLRDVIREEQSA